MVLQLSILYSARCADWRCRRAGRRRRDLSARLTAFAIAAALAVLMVYGESWMLSQESAASNELVVATCLVEAVHGDVPDASNACTSAAIAQDNKANAL